MLSSLKNYLSFLILALAFGSCTCQKEKIEKGEAEAALATEALPALMRLTPEQISRHLSLALEMEIGWRDQDGVFHDTIVEQLSVPLGGIDYVTANVRDPSPKVQTLLLVRNLAYNLAAAAVWRDAKPEAGAPLLFVHCSVREDLPGNNDEAEARWMLQLEDFYWRLFSRPPSEAERQLIRNAALEILKQESWPPTVWILVLYSLLSTEELWTV